MDKQIVALILNKLHNFPELDLTDPPPNIPLKVAYHVAKIVEQAK